jgi:hypothetical protein
MTNDEGCINSDSLDAVFPGSSDQGAVTTVKVFPNPTTTVVFVTNMKAGEPLYLFN